MRKQIFGLLGIVGLIASCSSPKAGFSLEKTDDVVPSSVTFTNSSTDADTYQWDLGDGSTSDEESPTHKYLKSGTYTVSLTAIKGNKQNTKEMSVEFGAPSSCLIEMTTPFGVMLIELYNETPQHRDNFMKLAEEGYYNDLLFHRVIDGFMVQGGDPDSKGAPAGQPLGMGGPGYQVPAEFDENYVHIKGALAAARTGDAMNPEKKSSGSQFYIVQGAPIDDGTLDVLEIQKGITYTPEQREQYRTVGGTPFLDMEYTVFGRVIEGLDVIDKIAIVQKDGRDRPTTDVPMKLQVIK